jgi:hypothetical protein
MDPARSAGMIPPEYVPAKDEMADRVRAEKQTDFRLG